MLREMYRNNCFESDVINSYAWDTATLFLQEYDDRTELNLARYSRQESVSGDELKKYGTVNEIEKDKICNVYDMASNCLEWTTETSSVSGDHCTRRGRYYTGLRYSFNVSYNLSISSFRPILYTK